jgi:isopentenyl-diphosphate Delta-isomerase
MPAPAPTAPVDVVDERNEPVATAQRGEVLSHGLNFRTVHIIITDAHEGVLLQRLAPSRERHPSRWGSSVAGYLHAGETYEAAASRRVQEELGVDAVLEFVGVTPMHDGRSTKFIGVFRATVRDEPTIRDPDHIADLRWIPLAALLEQIQLKPEAFTPSLVHVLNFLVATTGAHRVS